MSYLCDFSASKAASWREGPWKTVFFFTPPFITLTFCDEKKKNTT